MEKEVVELAFMSAWNCRNCVLGPVWLPELPPLCAPLNNGSAACHMGRKELWNKQWVRLQEQAREQAPGPKEALSCCPFDFHACLGEFANLQRALKCVNSCI